MSVVALHASSHRSQTDAVPGPNDGDHGARREAEEEVVSFMVFQFRQKIAGAVVRSRRRQRDSLGKVRTI